MDLYSRFCFELKPFDGVAREKFVFYLCGNKYMKSHYSNSDFKFQPNNGSIVIDKPNEDDYHFHIK